MEHSWEVTCAIPFSEVIGTSPYALADEMEHELGSADVGTLLSPGMLHLRELIWTRPDQAAATHLAQRAVHLLREAGIDVGLESTATHVGLAIVSPGGQRFAVPAAQVRRSTARPVRQELFGR